MSDITSAQELADRLESVGYLPDEGISVAAYLALTLGRPLFCEGEAGVGKTSLALALADVLGVDAIRLQCYEGLDAAAALYDWDFPRQLLHLRAAEAAGVDDGPRSRASSTTGGSCWPVRCCGPSRRASPVARRCCSSTRSTEPMTSSRRSCSRCWAASRCRCPSSARSGRRRRRWCADQQPDPRGPRRAEAPLPLPLGRAPVRRS